MREATGEATGEAARDEAESDEAESDEDCVLCMSCAHARFVRDFVNEHVYPVSSIARATSAADVLDTISRRANVPTDVVADILQESGWEVARCGTCSFYRMRDDARTFARVRRRPPRRR